MSQKKPGSLKLKLLSLLPKARRLATSALSLALIAGSLGLLVIKAPELHGHYLRYEVGSRTYMIKGKLDGGGGSGFQVKAASGQSYIVTNSHVCEGALGQSEDKTALLVVKDDGTSLRRRIIENSDFTDLCLLEGMPGVDGLSLSSEPGLGETAYVVGHPRLRPLSVSSGQAVGRSDVQILAYVMPTGDSLLDLMLEMTGMLNKEGKCELPKNQIVEIPVEMMGTEVGKIRLCLNVTRSAYMTTIVIHPGNSGSPMVDMWGNVEGVAFASDGTNWAYSVSLSDLRKFLSRY